MNIFKHIEKFFKKNLIVSWTISYIIVMIVPLVCTIYTYSHCEYVLKNQMYEIEGYALSKTLTSIDHIIYSLSSIPFSVENSKEISRIAKEDSINTETKVSLIEASKLLSSQMYLYENIHMVYIYLPKIDYCISNGYIASSENFFNTYYNPSDLAYDEYKKKINAFGYANYFVSKDKNSGAYIDFCYSLPLRTPSKPQKMMVVIRISQDNLKNIISQYISVNNKNLYIIDKDNNLIFDSNVFTDNKTKFYTDYVPNSIVTDGNFNVISCKSADTEWMLVSKTPVSVIKSQLSYIRMTSILSFILCLIVAIFLIWYFTNKNYRPIKKMVSFVKRPPYNSYKNEYDIINEIINDYRRDKRVIRHLKAYQNNITKSELLSDLMTGTIASDDYLSTVLENNGIKFSSDYFAIIIFNIMNAEALFSDDKSAKDLDDRERSKFCNLIISNIFEELISEKHSGIVFKFNGFNTAIISFNPETLSGWHDDLIDAINKTRDFINENFHFSFTSNISNIHKGICELPNAYLEATKTLDYRIFMKNMDIISYNEIIETHAPPIWENERISLLSSFIQLGNYKLAIGHIDALIDEISKNKGIHSINLIIFKLVSTVFDSVASLMNENTVSELNPLIDYIDSIIDTDINIQYLDKLHELIRIACDISTKHISKNKEQETNTDKLRDHRISANDIKKYINQNYTSSTLNIASIGYHFDISPYYMSTIFRNSEKISISDYIAKCRIDASKQIIAKTTAPLSEISEQVGFSSIRTFIRTFTKFENITPGQYREISKLKK